MLKGINDWLADARALVKLIAGIPAKINLIPFNPWPGAPYECSDWERIEKFAEVVNRAGYASPVRTPRGRDIMAACGQLKSASVKERAQCADGGDALGRAFEDAALKRSIAGDDGRCERCPARALALARHARTRRAVPHASPRPHPLSICTRRVAAADLSLPGRRKRSGSVTLNNGKDFLDSTSAPSTSA